MFLKLGTSVRGVHVNRVRPLLEADSRNQLVPGDWSPPLFFEGEGPPSSEMENSVDPVDSTLTRDQASATTTPEELTLPMEQHSESSEHPENSSPSAESNTVTTRSGRVVKPVLHFGWT